MSLSLTAILVTIFVAYCVGSSPPMPPIPPMPPPVLPPVSDVPSQLGGYSCPQWSPWEKTKCSWPVRDKYEAYPVACRNIHIDPQIPQPFKQYIRLKLKERYTIAQQSLIDRGLSKKPCGMCSHRLKCRRRQHKPGYQLCEDHQLKLEKAPECTSKRPCKMSLVNGGCPPPIHGSSGLSLFEDINSAHPMEPRILSYAPPDPPMPLPDIDLRSNHNEGTKEAPAPKPVRKSEADILADLAVQDTLETWNCIKNKAGNACLCCCGAHVPDPSKEKCIDTTIAVRKYLKMKMKNVAETHIESHPVT